MSVGAFPTDSKIFGMTVDTSGRRTITGHKSGGVRLWDLTRAANVAGVLLTQAVHTIDLLISLVGLPEEDGKDHGARGSQGALLDRSDSQVIASRQGGFGARDIANYMTGVAKKQITPLRGGARSRS
jgi:predicted dehydrogenase